ncbi:MAG: polyprenyl synthetase family protein [Chloroflexi bacterium]|nr:polyprenyl synthetase family protein [Chloroflexota bacterium]
MSLEAGLSILKSELERDLEALFSGLDCGGNLSEAMRYAVFPGGKRLRALLCLMTADMLGADRARVMPLAESLELIHAFSLVHDDLPCLDDDDFRRGKPSCHVAYGEANALLAGDALLILAFEALAGGLMKSGVGPEKALLVIKETAVHSGCAGMVGGQVFESEIDIPPGKEDLIRLCRKKTGALFRIALAGSAVLCDASPEEQKAITAFGEKLGLAFQVVDDLLDAEKSDEPLNFVNLMGPDETRKYAVELSMEAVEALKPLGKKADILIELARTLLEREN